MNDALASGSRARTGIGKTDERLFHYGELVFTVDHHVHVFWDYPGPSHWSYER